MLKLMLKFKNKLDKAWYYISHLAIVIATISAVSYIFYNYSNVIIPVLYVATAFLGIDMDIVKILMWLMLVDTIIGIIKSIKVNKIDFTFRNMYIGICAKFIILIIPFTLALVAIGVGYQFDIIAEVAIKMLILSEGISIFTNYLSIRENRIIKNKDYIAIILKFVRNKMMLIFDALKNNK